ncbi:SixA phosphatase family protein [Hymenobacter latericus]|uniref:SixA phosphatase family protein n=1 Tax=Hymenobacter sp. YIM 151858-1 TaxID=2987688 RepID=UPI002225EC77|nr:histidine phosphatase family protein [Hymenobacter sp. YIM 151858-1]UYZ60369.1 histidine phosphatase family protein [Hymenobacter sp. YIM 151858-1]
MFSALRTMCLLPLLFGTVASTAPEPAKPKITTVYVVRHAEKATEQNPQDPPLTPAGQARARALAEVLRKAPIVAVYSTNTRRTKDTATPLAEAKKRTIEPYEGNAPGLAALAARIRQTPQGKAVLVVGHSNTILETVEALGAPRPVPTIGDDEFSYLLEVKLPASGGPATATARHYGGGK